MQSNEHSKKFVFICLVFQIYVVLESGIHICTTMFQVAMIGQCLYDVRTSWQLRHRERFVTHAALKEKNLFTSFRKMENTNNAVAPIVAKIQKWRLSRSYHPTSPCQWFPSSYTNKVIIVANNCRSTRAEVSVPELFSVKFCK